MHLMSRLATRFDAVSKPAGGYWIFLPRGAGESVSGAPLQHYTLTRRDNSAGAIREMDKVAIVVAVAKIRNRRI